MKEQTLARIGTLLHRDKAVISDAVEAEAVKAFAKAAAEFFELDGGILFSVREDRVSISFHIVRVKNFTTLPPMA